MEKTVTVTQRNFKHLREQYGVKLKDIADICNLSQQTVNSFEKCKGEYTQINARSYNSDMMINALQSIINNKIIKKNTPMEKEVKHKKHNRLTDIDRSTFLIYLNSYLTDNNITMAEFCNMCELSTTQFENWYMERNPKLSNSAVRHISNATGWTYNDIKTGAFVKVKGEKLSCVPTEKSKEEPARRFGLGEERLKQHLEEETREFKLPHNAYDIKYTCDPNKDGCIVYYITYAVPTYHRQEVTKEKFLEMVGGDK